MITASSVKEFMNKTAGIFSAENDGQWSSGEDTTGNFGGRTGRTNIYKPNTNVAKKVEAPRRLNYEKPKENSVVDRVGNWVNKTMSGPEAVAKSQASQGSNVVRNKIQEGPVGRPSPQTRNPESSKTTGLNMGSAVSNVTNRIGGLAGSALTWADKNMSQQEKEKVRYAGINKEFKDAEIARKNEKGIIDDRAENDPLMSEHQNKRHNENYGRWLSQKRELDNPIPAPKDDGSILGQIGQAIKDPYGYARKRAESYDVEQRKTKPYYGMSVSDAQIAQAKKENPKLFEDPEYENKLRKNNETMSPHERDRWKSQGAFDPSMLGTDTASDENQGRLSRVNKYISGIKNGINMGSPAAVVSKNNKPVGSAYNLSAQNASPAQREVEKYMQFVEPTGGGDGYYRVNPDVYDKMHSIVRGANRLDLNKKYTRADLDAMRARIANRSELRRGVLPSAWDTAKGIAGESVGAFGDIAGKMFKKPIEGYNAIGNVLPSGIKNLGSGVVDTAKSVAGYNYGGAPEKAKEWLVGE